jgi:hypothetical protein
LLRITTATKATAQSPHVAMMLKVDENIFSKETYFVGHTNAGTL